MCIVEVGAQGRITDAFVRGSPFLRRPAVDQEASVRPHRPFHCCSWLPLDAYRLLTLQSVLERPEELRLQY